jgi:hypothetical protein
MYFYAVWYNYNDNSESKVPYFIPSERIPTLTWQLCVLLSYDNARPHSVAITVRLFNSWC